MSKSVILDLPYNSKTKDNGTIELVQKMAVYRHKYGGIYKPKNKWDRGSDISIDLTRNGRFGHYIKEMSFAAPMAGGGASSGAGAAAPAAAEEDEPAPAVQEKTLFTLKLQSFEAASKPKVIKEVKNMLGLSLVDSKKFVESAPKMLKEGIAKDEAEKIVEAMKALGAVVVME